MQKNIGIIYDESIEDYHGHKAISKSKLDDFLTLPALYHKKHILKEVTHKPGIGQKLGDATHTVLLEGEKTFRDRFCITPELSYRKKADKEASVRSLNSTLLDPLPEEQIIPLFSQNKDPIEEFFRKLPHKKQVSESEADKARELSKAIRANPLADMLLQGGRPEVTFRTETTPLGFQIQARTDYINLEGNEFTNGEPYIVDIKTIATLAPDDFSGPQKTFAKWGYHRQAAFYPAVVNELLERPVNRFFFIFVETKDILQSVVYEPDPGDVDLGWQQCLRGLQYMRECYASDTWPGYPQDLQILSLPSYERKRITEQLEAGA